MPVFGNLSTMSLPDLLQWAALTQKTGVLEIERNRICRGIEFRKGFIGACSSDDPSNRIGQVLLSRGKITEQMLQQLSVWNPAAIIAYLAGAVAAVTGAGDLLFGPGTTVPALVGLIVSIVTYLLAYYLAVAAGLYPDQARIASADA